MRKGLVLILLAGMGFAQTVKPVEALKVPDIPIVYQNQFKSLIIRQKDVQLHEKDLQAQFAADQRVELQINAEGQDLSNKLLIELKLDPKKYSVQYQNGEMKIAVQPEKK